MKLLLVNPPIPQKIRMLEFATEEVKKSAARRILLGPPLALNELAGLAPDEEIMIIDQKAEADDDADYNYLHRYEQVFRDFKPDYVGITCIAPQYNSAVNIIKLTKQLNPHTIVNAGGFFATLYPEGFIGTGVDVITLGMGKYSFKRMIEILKTTADLKQLRQTPGLAFDAGGRIEKTPALCSLSIKEIKENYLYDNVMPNRQLTDHYPYIFHHVNQRIHHISTSQGCTHQCNFCCIWQMTQGKYFSKGIENIIAEIKTMEKYPIIRFCDANTFGSVEGSKELFTRIIEEGLNGHFFMADVRADFVAKHPEIMEIAVKAGLKICICGLEAASDEELIAYGKASTVKDTITALKTMNELGIYVVGNYIVKPGYDKQDFDRLARFVQANPIYHSGFTVLTPFPGTAMYEEMKAQITIHDLDYYNLTNAVVETKLPEQKFYESIGELYRVSQQSTDIYRQQYEPD